MRKSKTVRAKAWAVLNARDEIIGSYFCAGVEIYWTKKDARKRWGKECNIKESEKSEMITFVPCTIIYELPKKERCRL